MNRLNEIRCPNRQCGVDPKTGQTHAPILATNAEAVGALTGSGTFKIEIRCRRCKTMVKIIYREHEILVQAA
jgi:hypothetical protein